MHNILTPNQRLPGTVNVDSTVSGDPRIILGLPNIYSWWDATDSSTRWVSKSSGATLATGVGDRIGRLLDKCGRVDFVAMADDTQRPTVSSVILDSKSGASGGAAGANQGLKADLVVNFSAYTYWAVLKSANNTDAFTRLFGMSDSDSTSPVNTKTGFSIQQISGTLNMYHDDGGSEGIAYPNASLDSAANASTHLVVWQWDRSDNVTKAWMDGGAAARSAAGAGTPPATIMGTKRAAMLYELTDGGENFTGTILEHGICTARESLSSLNALRRYLAIKYPSLTTTTFS